MFVAEDFYGNDYPEDEFETDDEFGKGFYRYRTNVSDNEGHDDEYAWSDGDDKPDY